MGNSNGKPVVLTDEVNLNHFRLLRVVGKGAFGKVRIVERKDTGLTFALKYIRKDEIVRTESVRNIIRERRMLEHLNHPFLCNLRYSFQDMEYLYIVTDLMNGGDLRFHISRKTFTEEAVRFWMAELGCALRYIHKQGIVHRDVKPDNVLLDSAGHVHLADFNVASDFVPGKPLTSKSGTLAYLAPEVYTGRGYLTEVDWWSLGVLFYECIYNKRPFDASHPDALAHSIVKGEPPFPVTSPPVSMPCNHAISSLLEKNKRLRIGALSWESFVDNPFFREIDFVALEQKQIEPIFCPPSEKTNFDATYDLEELLLEEAPLEARARKQKPRAELREDATQQEIRADELHRMIETMFEPFNYTTVPRERDPAVPATTVTTIISTAAESASPADRQYAQSDKDAPVTSHSVVLSPPDGERSMPTSRSHTPLNISRTRSSTNTAEGSPPLPLALLAGNVTSTPNGLSRLPTDPNSPQPGSGTSTPPSLQPSLPDQREMIKQRLNRYEEQQRLASNSPSAMRAARPRQSGRSTSMGGNTTLAVFPDFGPPGVGSTTHVSAHQHTLPHTDDRSLMERPSGVLGFLARKKGRDRSPRGKERERGVLGKEGARVIVSLG